MTLILNDVTRLPKWAQQRISKLEADVQYHQQKAAHALGDAPSRIEVEPYAAGDAPRKYISDRDMIRFTVPGGTIDVRLRDDGVEIVGNSNGIGNFLILPRASNVVIARCEPKRKMP